MATSHVVHRVGDDARGTIVAGTNELVQVTVIRPVIEAERPADSIGRFGNAAVGILVGPGSRLFSMTIGKSFAMAGASRLRLRDGVLESFQPREP
jgi:hypothetical protein